MGGGWQIRHWLDNIIWIGRWQRRLRRAPKLAKPRATRPAVRRIVRQVQSDVGSVAPDRNARGNIVFRDFFGLRLAFADRILTEFDALDGEPYTFIGDPRKLFDAPDPTRCLRDQYGIDSVANTIIGMTSAQGGWYRAVARLKSVGFQSFVIMLDPKRNERLVAKRATIQIHAIKAIFIPNYKSAYASFRQFCFGNFAEFEHHDRERSDSLNVVIDLSDPYYKQYFTFSIIRHPISRFKSLYFDKFCRADSHKNHTVFLMPVRSLLDKDQLTPGDVLNFISEVPDEFSDAHWKSQYFNTTHDGRPLVDSYVRMEHMDEDFEEIARRVHFRFALPKVLSTAKIARNHEHRLDFEQEVIRDKLVRRYPDDFLRLGYA